MKRIDKITWNSISSTNLEEGGLQDCRNRLLKLHNVIKVNENVIIKKDLFVFVKDLFDFRSPLLIALFISPCFLVFYVVSLWHINRVFSSSTLSEAAPGRASPPYSWKGSQWTMARRVSWSSPSIPPHRYACYNSCTISL